MLKCERVPFSIPRSVLVVFFLFVLVGSLNSAHGSVLFAIPLEPRTKVSSPPVFLQAGTNGSSTIYGNNTSARVSAAAPTPTPPTYYPNSNNTVTGTYVSGSVPASVQTVDSNYFIVKSSLTINTTNTYNPSGYSPLQSTKYVSGSTTNLQSNDANYMTFRSYVSASSATAKTDAFIAYRDSTTSLNTPKNRTWTGDTATWGSQSEMPTAGSPVRFVRVVYSPIEQRSFEKIVVTLSADGFLDAYVWDGASWNVTNNIASTGTVITYRCFDVAYEKTSGRALLVYSRGTTTNEIGYKTWTFGTGWSGESLIDLSYTTGIVNWISLASKPTNGANEIAMIYIDANKDVQGYVWTGSSWSLMGATAVWDSTAAIETEESIAVAYEQSSGRAMFIWGDTVIGDNNYRIWNGTGLSSTTILTIANQGQITNWVTLKANSDTTKNELMYLVVDGQQDLNTAYWSGSAWTIASEHDATVDTDAQRCADFAWEPTGSKGLLVWGTLTNATAAYITYRTFTAPNTWGTITNVAMGGANNNHPWVQLRANPRSITGDVKILGAILEATALDLGAIKWDGTTFTVIGTQTFSADTNVVTYESFDLRFQRFGPPSEFTSEVEFTRNSNTGSWTQLVWTIDGSFTTTNVNATFQLYNYQTGNYSTSGDGFMTATIGTTDVTSSQSITTNPTYFRDGSGNWKIKVKAVKTAPSQFDFYADWIEYKPIYTEYTVSTEFLFSSMTQNTPTQLNFTVVSEYDISSVSVTIQVWNYSASPPEYVNSGQGYATYSSSGSDQTRYLLITTNPQFYTSNENAKIKITGVKATATQYQQKINQVKLVYSYSSSSNYNYVLKIVNKVDDPWKIRLKAYSDTNKERLNNCTIYFRNSSDGASRQIYIQNGVYVNQTGPWYDLPAPSLTERYIVVTLQASDSEVSYVYVYLEILVPNKSTYARYVITFEIT